ncbi:SART-1 protein [Globomyces pollinis-pini]|nr:SART-1 protein [Globomyces pollinis-pini]
MSIEESNKLRASLGIKLLEVESSSKEQVAEDNFKKHLTEADNKKKKEKLIENIQKEKLKSKSKFTGKGLGEGDDDDDDPLSWIKKQEKKAKKNQLAIARKKAKQLEEQDVQYTADDLSGMKVSHAIDDLGYETILVLKDKKITDNDDGEDELMNVTIADIEHTRKNLELKKGKKAYNAYEAFEQEQMGNKRKLLSHYDEEDEPDTFVLSTGGAVNLEELEEKKKQVAVELRKGAVSLEYDKTQEVMDYYSKDELLAFRKPKKKKKKKESRKKTHNDDEIDANGNEQCMNDDAMEVDEKPNHEKYSNSNKTTEIDSMNFVDDDDLQQALSKTRSKNLKTNIHDLLQKVHEPMETDKDENVGLVISDLSEFVETLDSNSVLAKRDIETKQAKANTAAPINKSPSTQTKDDVHVDDEMELDDNADGESLKSDQEEVETHMEELSMPLYSSGLASTLQLLKQKGDLDKVTDERKSQDELQRQRIKWLQDQRLKDAQRERLLQQEKEANKSRGVDKSGKRIREDQYERDQRYRDAERERAREIQAKFADYKPVINLEYRDSGGRVLSTKDAFREFAHKFHGKRSGKTKTEKRLSKLEEAAALQRMQSTDTPLGTASAFANFAKETGSTHVVLSKGHKNTIPEAPTTIAKPVVEAEEIAVAATVIVPQPQIPREPQVFTPVVDNPIPAVEGVTALQPNREKITFGLSLKKKPMGGFARKK